MKKLIPILVLIAAAAFAATYDTPGIVGGGGGDTVNAPVAYGSIPACSTSEFFQPLIASPYDYVYCNGSSTLTHYIGGLQMTPVVSGDYAWDNQDTASTSTVGGAVKLSSTANAGVELYVRYKTSPSTPWTITLAVVQNYGNTTNYAGLVVGDGTKYTAFYDRSDAITVSNWNSATSFSANVRASGDPMADTGFHGLRWYRVADDGTTNLTWSASYDGVNFETFATQGRTSFLTSPSRVGFFLGNSDGTYTTSAAYVHWLQE